MKNLSRILWGIVLIFIGVIWGLNRTGVADINIFFDGWWTLFIIVPSIISLFESGSNKTSSIIFLVIGILLLLASQGVFEFEILWEILLPAIVILIGLSLIFGHKVDFNVKEKTKCLDSKDTESIFAAFGEQNVSKSGEKFEKANLNAIFGAVKLDLREAKLEKETVIGAWAIFGGIEILVPDDCIVKVKGTPIFGGISNERKNNEDAKKTIYIEAYTIFGGLDIK